MLFFFSPFLSVLSTQRCWIPTSGAGPIALRPWLAGWLVLFSVRRAPRSHTHPCRTAIYILSSLSLRVYSMCVCLPLSPLQDIFRALVPG